MASRFLPTSAKEVEALGWDYIDVILFSGDAYIDHPSFGIAVIGRLLEAEGYRVAIVPQPNWRDDLRDFRKLGAPRLFFGVSAGSMDSMVNHYTAHKRLRHDDAYTPGGAAGFRPDYAVTTYTRILKQLYPHTPVVVGGIEASLRRLTHYDYWSDSLHPSILIESGADLLMYGMGDRSIVEVAKALKNGYNAKLLRKLRQVGFVADREYVDRLPAESTIRMASYEECVADKRAFSRNFVAMEVESNRMEQNKTIVEQVGERYVVINPPYEQMTTEQLDHSFDLPYTRLPHPRYKDKAIPAYEMIKHSVNIHRGCFGGCSFCTISAHQGKFVTSRSERSILAEVEKVKELPDFKGYLSDIGGPSADMYRLGGKNLELCKRCVRPTCLTPSVCPNLNRDLTPLLSLYRNVREVKGIKKAFIGSGIRYDIPDDGGRYMSEVIFHHTSGRLKVAPEHTEPHVLKIMRKPPFEQFEQLYDFFLGVCRQKGLKYQLIPYFISSHPGCTEEDMARLSRKVRALRLLTDQVQDLTPTPMTLSSAMFYTGEDPYTSTPLYVARTKEDKMRQKSYFFEGTKSPQGGRTSQQSGRTRMQGGAPAGQQGGHSGGRIGGRMEERSGGRMGAKTLRSENNRPHPSENRAKNTTFGQKNKK